MNYHTEYTEDEMVGFLKKNSYQVEKKNHSVVYGLEIYDTENVYHVYKDGVVFMPPVDDGMWGNSWLHNAFDEAMRLKLLCI